MSTSSSASSSSESSSGSSASSSASSSTGSSSVDIRRNVASLMQKRAPKGRVGKKLKSLNFDGSVDDILIPRDEEIVYDAPLVPQVAMGSPGCTFCGFSSAPSKRTFIRVEENRAIFQSGYNDVKCCGLTQVYGQDTAQLVYFDREGTWEKAPTCSCRGGIRGMCSRQGQGVLFKRHIPEKCGRKSKPAPSVEWWGLKDAKAFCEAANTASEAARQRRALSSTPTTTSMNKGGKKGTRGRPVKKGKPAKGRKGRSKSRPKK